MLCCEFCVCVVGFVFVLQVLFLCCEFCFCVVGFVFVLCVLCCAVLFLCCAFCFSVVGFVFVLRVLFSCFVHIGHRNFANSCQEFSCTKKLQS